MTSLAGIIDGRILAINSPNIKLSQEKLGIKNKNKEVLCLISIEKEPTL